MVIGEEEDEAAVLAPLVAESLADSDVIFLAGTTGNLPASARTHRLGVARDYRS